MATATAATSCQIIPSSGAIYSSSDPDGRTFYYASLNIEWSSQWKWKVHVGDLVAVSTTHVAQTASSTNEKMTIGNTATKRQQQQRVQEIEKWNANHYTKPSPHWRVGLVLALSKRLSKTVQGVQFDCHVQWLDKAMDLSAAESGSLKMFRPFIARNGKSGSQKPHILINRPGDFGVISPLDVLPVEIVIMAKHDFSGTGVKEEDESQYSLKFCCLKTRRDGFLVEQDKGVFNEPNPDVWTFVNPPMILNGSSTSVVSISQTQVPQPLEKAWQLWLSTSQSGDRNNHHAPLKEAFRKGWRNMRRERHTKAVLQDQAKQKERAQKKNEKVSTSISRKQAKSSSKRDENAVNSQNGSKRTGKRSFTADDKKNGLQHPKVLAEEQASEPAKKKRGIRFSADTKQDAKRENTVSATFNTKANVMKRPRSGIIPSKESNKGKKMKSAKLAAEEDNQSTGTTEGNGSTVTQETHSTDTTLPTRGAGRKQPTFVSSHQDDGESLTVCTDSSIATNLSDLLLQRDITPSHRDPIIEIAGKKYYGRLEISIGHDSWRHFFDSSHQPESMLDANANLTFKCEIGSVVAIYSKEAATSSGMWSPFRIPWSVAQITSIFYTGEDSDDFSQWQIGIKWFYRYPELQKTRQKLVQGSMDESVGLVETQEICSCSAMAILPAYVRLTFEKKAGMESWSFEKTHGGIPTINMVCGHFSHGKNKISATSDWSVDILPRQLSSVRAGSVVPKTVARAIAKVRKDVKAKYFDWLRNRELCSKSFEAPAAPSKRKNDFRAPLSAPTPLYEQWGAVFYDSVGLKIDKDALHPGFVPLYNEWVLAVGHVIALRHKNGRKNEQNDADYFPFRLNWSPAQVVAIYRTASGSWRMQIRWFQRFSEILNRHKQSFRELDLDHFVFETEIYDHIPVEDALPGRIVMTSHYGTSEWVPIASKATGLPLIPRLCTHMCLDEEMDSSSDWTNYDIELSDIPSPLSRGLRLTPANRTNKEWVQMLYRHYTKAIRSRQNDSEHDDLIEMRCKVQPNQGWNPGKVGPNDIEVSVLAPIDRVEPSPFRFFHTLAIKVPQDCLADPTNEMKRNKGYVFECSVGDTVCFFDEKTHVSDLCYTSKKMQHPFYPFEIPWSFGQILSIRKDTEADATAKIELRRFFRHTDLPIESISFVSLSDDSHLEEVFESDVVIELDANRIVGQVEVFLGHHTASATESSNSFYATQCRCKYFYFSAYERVQPLYCSSLLPGDWQRALRRRAFELSPMLRENQDVKMSQLSNEGHGVLQSNFLELLSPSNKKAEEGSVKSVNCPFRGSGSQDQCFEEVILHPQWSLFRTTGVVIQVEDVKRCSWRLSVGDFLAVKSQKNPSSGPLRFPYKVPWFPCQLLAAFGESHSFQFEVRVLMLQSNDGKDEVNATSPEQTMTVGCLDLLGPLILHCRSKGSEINTTATYLPRTEFWAAKSLNTSTSYALSLSKHCSSQRNRQADRNAEESGIRLPGEAWVVGEPFHLESSTGRAFFDKVGVRPLFAELDLMGITRREEDIVVKTGDVVLAQFEGSKRHPFECNWAVADVVAIFVEGTEAMSDSFHSGRTWPTHQKEGRIKAEIRWFYERQDFSGVSADEREDQSEVFETDHTQIVDVGKVILSHASLLDSREKFKLGFEKHNFVCQRFWSTQRKSLIPCGGLDGRKKRALLYSKCLPTQIIASVSPSRNESRQMNSFVGWKDAMVRLQQKLMLKDASKYAYDGENSLVGRQKEISELLAFFRSAIRAESSTGELKSAMIVAGPPGVGKTASVHAAISKLLKEQEKGVIPKFRFIGLNGMEQRHPFDTYVRFWEALTGKKHTGSQDRACELLEDYFTSSSQSSNDITTVVLLDEIDYLITEKQSVLYNFFDWPKRAAKTPNGRRLVVVGLSNTLNLVEQLIPSVQSRVGTEKCIFKAYSLQDTVNILKAKMTEASQVRLNHNGGI
jgi:ATPase family associated with various cellular activities (AAA)